MPIMDSHTVRCDGCGETIAEGEEYYKEKDYGTSPGCTETNYYHKICPTVNQKTGGVEESSTSSVDETDSEYKRAGGIYNFSVECPNCHSFKISTVGRTEPAKFKIGNLPASVPIYRCENGHEWVDGQPVHNAQDDLQN